jgi:N-methylhydantoinase A/oxoprolinase/acetone carboxylase beta subunit/N-methylhydantoinase B/oxoprolinase/acetone carboxylase alpha subunit
MPLCNHSQFLNDRNRKAHNMLRIGIDTGGTFTDLVALDAKSGNVAIVKVPSTPTKPASAPITALRQANAAPNNIDRVVIGTTIALNARLQKHGSVVLYIGTKGAEDVPIIARIDRKEGYNPAWPKPDTGIKRRHIFGIDERVDNKGNVLVPLENSELTRLGEWVAKWIKTNPNQNWAVAVNLLFSYVNPAHEKAIGEYLARKFPQLTISLSHEVAPIWREYERGTTVITDAFIKKIIGDFSKQVMQDVRALGIQAPISLMKSNGGHVEAQAAEAAPVQLLLSGLAGGVIAGRRFARDHAAGNGVTLDMGGTSTDVGLIVNGEFDSTTEYEVEWGVPVSALFIDYTSIGAGGGSIAYVDTGGLLKVGPQSAGAEPGPACYGLGGTQPTVTDANVVLGRLDPEFFLGGKKKLNPRLARQAMEQLAAKLHLSIEETSLSILDTAAANMANAIRLLTVDRGLDARDFSLIAFGGAGPLHAVDIARHLGMEQILVPPHPGLVSALGTVLTGLRVDRARTVNHRTDRMDFKKFARELKTIVTEALAEIKRDGHSGKAVLTYYANMRYLGQNFGEPIKFASSEITQSTLDMAVEDFHRRHKELFGYALTDRVIEITEIRVIVLGGEEISANLSAPKGGEGEPYAKRKIYFGDAGYIDTAIYRREVLPEGAIVKGPALIEEMDSTTLLHPGDVGKVQHDGTIVIHMSEVAERAVQHVAGKGKIAPEKDPTTLTVVGNALRNISDEMGSAMVRTAYSPIFSESRDFSCFLFDRHLRMVGQAEMNPAIICAGLLTIPQCIREIGMENFHEGDIVLHNDPYRGQCHMPEHLLLKPIFIDKTLIGFAGNIAHIGEIGGMAVGSFASTATEVFQEGLRLPPVKLMSRGEYCKDVWRIILANHRTPNATWGDFHAMMGSLTTAERRLQALVARYGLESFERICDALIDHAEKWMRSEIRKIPNGVYSSSDYYEDDGVSNQPYYFRANVHVEDENILIDLSASDQQAAGPINVTYVATSAACSAAVLQSVCTRDVPLNGGTFRPIKVVAPPGTVANPIFPAPSVAGNTEGQPRIISCVLGALAKAMPGRIGASETGTGLNMLMGGIHPETGEFWTHYQLEGGGWGGRADRDGNSAQTTAHASTIRTTPIEVFESRFPLRVLDYSLHADSGGAGQFRGGLGIRREFAVIAPSVTFSSLTDRVKEGPWGLYGGKRGYPAGIFIKKRGDTEYRTFKEVFGTVSPTKFINIKLEAGDQFMVFSPGGGGYGDPANREDAALLNDLADRFVTAAGLKAYGRPSGFGQKELERLGADF